MYFCSRRQLFFLTSIFGRLSSYLFIKLIFFTLIFKIKINISVELLYILYQAPKGQIMQSKVMKLDWSLEVLLFTESCYLCHSSREIEEILSFLGGLCHKTALISTTSSKECNSELFIYCTITHISEYPVVLAF